ncbi:MAG: SLC13/DASS family transporter [Verrucomicrobiae bacterium]|nr:SLC13/DASS family transporter [Verrucomicrobiae bacterium]
MSDLRRSFRPGETAPAPRSRSIVWTLLGLAAGAVTAFAVLEAGALPREAGFMAGIFVTAALLWITEAIPLFATSLLVLGLQSVLLANPGGWAGLGFAAGDGPTFRALVQEAADPILLLFLGGFLLARAAVKTGADRSLSGLLLRPFGTQPHRILLGVMLVTLFFSMWMSNTATTALMLALLNPLLSVIPAGDPFRKTLVLSVPLAANIGGMGTPIASPPNAIAVGYLSQEGRPIAFFTWMFVAVPVMLILVATAWKLLRRRFPSRIANLDFDPALVPLTPRGRWVTVVGAATLLLWITDSAHGLPAPLVALLAVLVLIVSGMIGTDDLAGVDWGVLILIAGGISLGTGMQRVGLDRAIAEALPLSGAGPSVLLAVLMLVTLVLGPFMSNTAIATLLIPVGLAAAGGASAHPTGVPLVGSITLAIALCASLTMALPSSTPPNAMAYATREFSTRDLLQVTLPVSGLGGVLIFLVCRFVLHWLPGMR